MLDVHAPHHTPSGVRDFFLHLFTITVGLLIALGLENAAEAIHHRHERKEAETMIREEIRKNDEDLKKEAANLKVEGENMARFIALNQAVIQGKPLPAVQPENFGFHEEEIPDAAWRTASSTGVLAYMPYDEVERFSDAYREQELLQNIARQTLDDYLDMTAAIQPDPANPRHLLPPTKEQAIAFLPVAERALGHLNGIHAAGAGTLQAYKTALQ